MKLRSKSGLVVATCAVLFVLSAAAQLGSLESVSYVLLIGALLPLTGLVMMKIGRIDAGVSTLRRSNSVVSRRVADLRPQPAVSAPRPLAHSSEPNQRAPEIDAARPSVASRGKDGPGRVAKADVPREAVLSGRAAAPSPSVDPTARLIERLVPVPTVTSQKPTRTVGGPIREALSRALEPEWRGEYFQPTLWMAFCGSPLHALVIDEGELAEGPWKSSLASARLSGQLIEMAEWASARGIPVFGIRSSRAAGVHTNELRAHYDAIFPMPHDQLSPHGAPVAPLLGLLQEFAENQLAEECAQEKSVDDE